MRYLLLLLLTFALNAQTLNFTRFTPDTAGTAKAVWSLNAATNQTDLTGNGFMLTKRSTGDSVTVGVSPVVSGDNVYYFSGNDYFDANQNVLKTSDFTMGVWIKSSTNPAANQVFITEDDESANRDFIFMDYNVQDKIDLTMFIGGVVKFMTSTQTSSYYLDGRWHFVMVSHDGSNIYVGVDGLALTSAAAVGAIDNDGAELHVGADGKATPTLYYTGEMAYPFIDTTATTTQAAFRKLVYLADGWHSRQGNVIRRRNGNNFYFHQGFWADTLSYPVTVAAGNRGVSITAFASDVDTLTVQTSLETKVLALSASPQTFTFNMMFAATDSLKLLDSSVADTIFASAGSVRSQIYVDTKSGGFKGWLGY